MRKKPVKNPEAGKYDKLLLEKINPGKMYDEYMREGRTLDQYKTLKKRRINWFGRK